MKLLVERFLSDSDTTLSIVSIISPTSKDFACFGLEDEYRERKIIGETRIPAGIYQIGLRRHGRFHDRYKHRFARIHDGMLEIMDVPGFTDILIHCGNTDADTSGCLLLGSGANTTLNDMSITNSVAAYKDVYGQIIGAARRGELCIQIVNNGCMRL